MLCLVSMYTKIVPTSPYFKVPSLGAARICRGRVSNPTEDPVSSAMELCDTFTLSAMELCDTFTLSKSSILDVA